MTYTVLKEDFDKILDMEDIAEQSYDFMEVYVLAKELANNITLVEGEMDKKSQKINKASNVLEYYNDVYLIFFKSYGSN